MKTLFLTTLLLLSLIRSFGAAVAISGMTATNTVPGTAKLEVSVPNGSGGFVTRHASVDMLFSNRTVRPNVLVYGDSRSFDGVSSNWVNYIRTNVSWNNRAAFKNYSYNSKALQNTVDNIQDEVVKQRPAMATQDVAVVWMGINDQPTYTDAQVQANLTNLWNCLRTNGFRIIQIGHGHSGGGVINSVMESFLESNGSTWGYTYVVGTNFARVADGVHPTYPGAQTIGERVLTVLTNMISSAPQKAVSGTGHNSFRALQGYEHVDTIALDVFGDARVQNGTLSLRARDADRPLSFSSDSGGSLDPCYYRGGTLYWCAGMQAGQTNWSFYNGSGAGTMLVFEYGGAIWSGVNFGANGWVNASNGMFVTKFAGDFGPTLLVRPGVNSSGVDAYALRVQNTNQNGSGVSNAFLVKAETGEIGLKGPVYFTPNGGIAASDSAGTSIGFQLHSNAVTSVALMVTNSGGANFGRLAFSTNCIVMSGVGSPDGAVSAGLGSLFMRLDGAAAGTFLYVKTNGTGNTGWYGLR